MSIKYLLSMFLTLALACLLGEAAALASDLTTENTSTSVTIKKGDDPDFTIVADTAEIAGDPVVGDKEARASWKSACAAWKAELKELNKENRIISMNCGVPKGAPGGNASTIYVSTGAYKVRVRIRNEGKSK